MNPSYSTCRAQEARQHAIAISADLANTRMIAAKAEAAWAREALLAAKREDRALNRKYLSDDEMPQEFLMAEERSFSENPDRGFAATHE